MIIKKEVITGDRKIIYSLELSKDELPVLKLDQDKPEITSFDNFDEILNFAVDLGYLNR